MANLPLDSTLIRNELEKWLTLQGTNDSTLVSLATRICELLRQSKKFLELDVFLKLLPLETEDVHLNNELIVRAKIALAFEERNYPLIYNLIESHNFQNGEELIEIWDKAHYAEEEQRTQKPLTPLKRFRIRQRFIPPESICPTRERKKATLPKKSKDILQGWFNKNIDKPYPSKKTKECLSKKANLTIAQVGTWFGNARRRFCGKTNKRVRCYGNECVDSDEALNHVIRNYRRQCLENKNNDEKTTIEHVIKDTKESPSKTGDTIADGVINTVVVSHPESVSCQVTAPNHTSASSSRFHENETSSLTSLDVISTMAPPLQLIEPPVNLGFNILYREPHLPTQFTHPFACTPTSCAMWKYTPCCMFSSNSNTPGCNVVSLSLEPFVSAQYNFQQIVQLNCFGEDKPDVSTSQDLYEHLSVASEKEPFNCYQQINMLNQTPMSPQYSGTVTAHGEDSGMDCGSPGHLRRFNAATALLDMSVNNSCSCVFGKCAVSDDKISTL